MSKLGDYIKQQKEKDIQKFFGEIKHTSNKYFTFNSTELLMMMKSLL